VTRCFHGTKELLKKDISVIYPTVLTEFTGKRSDRYSPFCTGFEVCTESSSHSVDKIICATCPLYTPLFEASRFVHPVRLTSSRQLASIRQAFTQFTYFARFTHYTRFCGHLEESKFQVLFSSPPDRASVNRFV
jgi:hypothetical protein